MDENQRVLLSRLRKTYADRVEHHRSIDNWVVAQAVLVVYIFAFCKLGSVKSIGEVGI